MQKGAEKAQVDPRAPVSPPRPRPIHPGGICDTYEHSTCLQFQMSCHIMFTAVCARTEHCINVCIIMQNTEIIRCRVKHMTTV